jgi:hypothetical protein
VTESSPARSAGYLEYERTVPKGRLILTHDGVLGFAGPMKTVSVMSRRSQGKSRRYPGLTSFAISAVPSGLIPVVRHTQHYVLGYSQSPLRGWSGLVMTPLQGRLGIAQNRPGRESWVNLNQGNLSGRLQPSLCNRLSLGFRLGNILFHREEEAAAAARIVRRPDTTLVLIDDPAAQRKPQARTAAHA